jgi:plastocyanin
MTRKYPSTPIFYSAVVIITIFTLAVSSFTSNSQFMATAQVEPESSIDATSLFDTGQMIVPSNVKQLVILVPNEGHHGPGEEDEARFIAQPFIPQNAVVDPGTQVVWFNGDVGHEHNIIVNDNNGNQIFETGEFTELVASRPITFNDTGIFEYADTVEYEEGFVMTGDITVRGGGQGNNADMTNTGNFDSAGALMVPSPFVEDTVESMRSEGFGIDSTHTFTDLRGGQSDTGDQQVLLVWTADGKSLDEITSYLGEVSEPLPYE